MIPSVFPISDANRYFNVRRFVYEDSRPFADSRNQLFYQVFLNFLRLFFAIFYHKGVWRNLIDIDWNGSLVIIGSISKFGKI